MILDLTVRPPWPSEPPRSAGPGGLTEIKDGIARRATRVDGEIALAEAVWRGDEVLLRAHAATEDAAREALRRMRFVLSLDDELEPFHRAYRSDPLLGRVIRARPKLRVLRKPEPFEALAWAVIEQLIDTQAAGNIAWTLTRRHGERHPRARGARRRPRSSPTPPRSRPPASLPRSRARSHGSRKPSTTGRSTPAADDQRRLDAIPGVGEWTLAHLNLFGRGLYDVPLPATSGCATATRGSRACGRGA